MNQLMKEQGMPVDQFTTTLKKIFRFELTKRSPQYNIAMTAAAEHLTALMAETFYSHKNFRKRSSLCSSFVCMACD